VVFTDRVEGTTLSGPELEYYRVMEGRPEALVNAMGRPRLTLRRQAAAGGDTAAARPSESGGAPLAIDANRMTIEGRNDLTAFGNVVIEDANIRAVADEAEQRGTAETLELRGGAEIHSREYSLTGAVIFATVPGGTIRDVEARGDARLLGADLNVRAPRLDLVFENDLLQRSIASSDEALAPGIQPLATSATFRLQADSIDATLPGQRLEMVVAIGNARGETIDTTSAAADSAAADGLPPEDADPLQVAADTAGEADTLAEAAAAGDDGPPRVAAMFERGDSVTTASAVELVENDWITGDTITGYFSSRVASVADSVAEAAEDADGVDEPEADQPDLALEPAAGSDTTVVMERLVAVGAARSLYHVAPEEGSPPGTRRGINFLSAAHIELQFVDGQVQVADVTGLRRGLYLEPLAVAATPLEGGVAPLEGDGDDAPDATGAEPGPVREETVEAEDPAPDPIRPQNPGDEP
jgi:hypothetical protein